MKRTLKATTALLASVNLAVPLPALAQAEAQRSEAVSRAAEACAVDETSAECQAATEDAIAQGATDDEIEAAGAAEGEAEATAPITPEAPAEAGTSAQADSDASAQTEAAPSTAETGAAPSEESADVTSEGATEAEAEAAAPAPDQPAADAPVEPVEEAQGADAGASTQGEADQSVSPEGEVSQEQSAEPQTAETSASEGTQSQATAETTTSAAESDLPSEDDLRQGLSAGTESPESTEADVEAEAETAAEADVTTDTTETDREGDLPAEAELREGLAAGSGDATNAETQAEAEVEGETAEGTSIEEETAAETSTAPETEVNAEAGATAPTDAEAEAMAGTAPVAAAAAEDAEVVETTSDTVTEETARSSTEDFDSAISRQPAEQTQSAQAGNDDRGGLSNLEKALLVGAGALAVGAILNGNRRVVASSEDRVVVAGRDGGYELIKDDTALLRQPGAEVRTETFDDGSTRTTVTYDDGSQVVTIRDADLRVVRRVRVTPDGERIVLIDDLNQNIQPVDRSRLRPVQQQSRTVNLSDDQALRQALSVQRDFDRAYSLSQVRNIAEVRQQVPAVDLDAITFDTGSAAIRPEQADELRGLGTYIRETIASDPRAVFLVEGHTDAVGDAAYNLALSDRRAESVALALGEYFNVPTANLVVQGYGERYLKVPTEGPERANRRATVRNITPLLQVAAAN